MEYTTLKDRIRGALIGGAIGDALGYPVEFMTYNSIVNTWKSHATLTLLAKQDLLTFGYNMIAPLKSWCWGAILFYPF